MSFIESTMAEAKRKIRNEIAKGLLIPSGFVLLAAILLMLAPRMSVAVEGSPKSHTYQLQWGTNVIAATAFQGSAKSFFVQKAHSEYECDFVDEIGTTRIAIQDNAGASGMVAPISDDANGVKTLVRFSVSSQRMGEHLVLSNGCSFDEQSTQAVTITKVVTIRADEPQIIALPDGSELIVRITASQCRSRGTDEQEFSVRAAPRPLE